MATTKTVTATELVRNCAAIIDEVQSTGEAVLITRGKRVVAELSPPQKKAVTLAGAFEQLRNRPGPKLSEEEAEAFKADLKRIREFAKLPDNPWE